MGWEMRTNSDFAHTMRDILKEKRIPHAKECISGKWGEICAKEKDFLIRYVGIFDKNNK